MLFYACNGVSGGWACSMQNYLLRKSNFLFEIRQKNLELNFLPSHLIYSTNFWRRWSMVNFYSWIFWNLCQWLMHNYGIYLPLSRTQFFLLINLWIFLCFHCQIGQYLMLNKLSCMW